jgi:CheY-like chemotaxis protein
MSALGKAAPRLLVVDDQASVRLFAERVAQHGGYDVTTASDGPEALRIVAAHGPFALYLIDIMMPEMRGDELVRRIRATDRDAKVLYLTGHSDKLFEERRVLWENEAFVEKPVKMQGLLEAISLQLFGHTRGLVGAK